MLPLTLLRCWQVLDVALVSLMAPAAVLGGASKAAMSTGWLAKALANVPSAFFEASIPVSRSMRLRLSCLPQFMVQSEHP